MTTFTIYIHVLEVVAMNINGVSMATIGNMGLCFKMTDIQRAVRELEKEGFITHERNSETKLYKITEKALEYCETVVRKHDNALADEDVNILGSTSENMPSEGPQDAITGENSTPSATTLPEGQETPQNDDFDECAYCGAKFRPETSWDNFYCDQCYLDGNHLEGDYGYGDGNIAYHPSLGYWNEYGEFIYYDEEDGSYEE